MCRLFIGVNINVFYEYYRDKAVEAVYSGMERAAYGGNTDACGFAAFRPDGAYARVRLPVPCTAMASFMRRKGMLAELVSESKFLIVHARNATVGSPLLNWNNHPFLMNIDGKPVALAHNGSVHLSDVSKSYENKIRKIIERYIDGAETDSARLLAAIALEKDDTLFERAKKAWAKFTGKASVVAASPDELVYSVNTLADIYYVHDSDSGIAFLATSKEQIRKVAELLKLEKGLGDYNKHNYCDVFEAKETVSCKLTSGMLGFRDRLSEISALSPIKVVNITSTSSYNYYYPIK